MNQKTILSFCAFVLLSFNLWGQRNELLQFGEEYFNSDTLPFDFSFSDSDKVYIENHYFEEENKEVQLDTNKRFIPFELAQEHLFQNSDSVAIQNLWNRDTLWYDSIEKHFENYTYYTETFIPLTTQLYGLIYHRMDGEGMETYICTYNSQGEFIDRALIGFYTHSGSFSTANGGREPWFVLREFHIDSNLIIETFDYGNSEQKIKIGENGHFQLLD